MRMDAVEALANAIVGLVVSWTATLLVLGYGPAESAAITALFFSLSFVRAWVLRVIFRRLA